MRDGPRLIIECVHVDDEMWHSDINAYTIGARILESVGVKSADIPDDWFDRIPNDKPSSRILQPIKTKMDLAGVPVYIRLTQTSKFRKALDQIQGGYYHMVVSDAVDTGTETLAQTFEDYSGSQLLRGIPWRSTERLIYSKEYHNLWKSERIDLIARYIGGFITDHPTIPSPRDDVLAPAEGQFAHRIASMVKDAVKYASIENGRFWFRCTSPMSYKGTIGAEILERQDDQWNLVSSVALQVESNEKRPGGGKAEYVALVFFIGHSRARVVTRQEIPLPDQAFIDVCGRAPKGPASWMGGLWGAYDALVGGRNKEDKRFKNENAFKKFMSSEDGFWPGVVRDEKYSDRIPPIGLNILDELIPIKESWLPQAKMSDSTGSEQGPFDLYYRDGVEPVIRFLPQTGDQGLFPLKKMRQSLRATYKIYQAEGDSGKLAPRQSESQEQEQEVFRLLKIRLEGRPGDKEWETKSIEAVAHQRGMQTEQVLAILEKGRERRWK